MGTTPAPPPSTTERKPAYLIRKADSTTLAAEEKAALGEWMADYGDEHELLILADFKADGYVYVTMQQEEQAAALGTALADKYKGAYTFGRKPKRDTRPKTIVRVYLGAGVPASWDAEKVAKNIVRLNQLTGSFTGPKREVQEYEGEQSDVCTFLADHQLGPGLMELAKTNKKQLHCGTARCYFKCKMLSTGPNGNKNNDGYSIS